MSLSFAFYGTEGAKLYQGKDKIIGSIIQQNTRIILQFAA